MTAPNNFADLPTLAAHLRSELIEKDRSHAPAWERNVRPLQRSVRIAGARERSKTRPPTFQRPDLVQNHEPKPIRHP